MAEVNLSIDSYAHLEPEGIAQTVYIGDASEPSIELTHDWSEIINSIIENHTVPFVNYIPYESPEDLDEVFEMVHILRKVADEIEDRFMELDAFDRSAWLADEDEDVNLLDRTKYLTPMKEMRNA